MPSIVLVYSFHVHTIPTNSMIHLHSPIVQQLHRHVLVVQDLKDSHIQLIFLFHLLKRFVLQINGLDTLESIYLPTHLTFIDPNNNKYNFDKKSANSHVHMAHVLAYELQNECIFEYSLFFFHSNFSPIVTSSTKPK
jgi:hypothetical protein